MANPKTLQPKTLSRSNGKARHELKGVYTPNGDSCRLCGVIGGQPGYIGGIEGLYELLSILALLRDHEGWT